MNGQLDAAGVGTAVDHDVNAIIFHRGIQVFFDDSAEPVDLIDKKNVVGFEVCEKPRQIAGFFDDGSGSFFDIDAKLIGYDPRQSSLSQAGGGREKGYGPGPLPSFSLP